MVFCQVQGSSNLCFSVDKHLNISIETDAALIFVLIKVPFKNLLLIFYSVFFEVP